MNLIPEKQDVFSEDEVTLTLFLFDWLVQRERLQKSMALKMSYDSDSNQAHLFDFPLFVMVAVLV